MELTVGGVTRRCAGRRVCHPAQRAPLRPHVRLDCVALDIFSPPRSDFRELIERATRQPSTDGVARRPRPARRAQDPPIPIA